MGVARTDYSIRFQITTAGQTSFSFPFSAGDAADIQVFDNDAKLPTSRFSVTSNPNGLDSGGTVTLGVALAVGRILEIRRDTPKTQGMSLHEQAAIPPRALERALDKLTRVDQELMGKLDFFSGSQKQEEEERKAADDALGKRIDAEVSARVAADNTITGFIDDERADRVATDTSHQAQITALGNTKADAVTLANEALASLKRDESLLARIVANLAAITQLDAGKMPVAPNDGRHHVAVGKSWEPLENGVGNPFGLNANGYAIATVFLAYLANKVWDILPDRRVLSRASRTGDSDGIFAITEDGRFAVRVGPPFVRAADGRALVSKRPAYLPNTIWNIGTNRLTRSRASRPGDSDGVFVIDAGGRAVRAR